MKNILTGFALLGVMILSSGVHAQDKGKYEQARSRFREGLVLFNRMNYLAAAEYFRKALEVYDEYHTAREYLARSYRLAGYSAEAAEEWDALYSSSSLPAAKSRIEILKYHETADFAREDMIDELSHVRSIKSSALTGARFPYPVDLAVDAERNLYVTAFKPGKVVKFDPNGKVLKTIVPESSGSVYGIAVTGDRVLYTDFTGDRVVVADRNLRTIRSFGSRGTGEGQFHGPEGIAIDAAGFIYVADSGNHRVLKFSPDYKFQFAFGRNGAYEGELASPTDIAVLDKRVYVTDTDNARIAVFDSFGNWESNITIPNLRVPRGITVVNNHLLIADNTAGLVFYNPVTGESSVLKEYKPDTEFNRVNAAAFSRDGTLFALDHARESVEMLIPLKKRYSNLDVEITSVDTAKFPVIAVHLAVRGRDGAPVYSLKKDNFTLREDKALIRSLYVDYYRELPVKSEAVLCVDRSRDAEKFSDLVPWAADFYLRAMKKNDRVKIIEFSADAEMPADFDWSRLRSRKILSTGVYREGRNTGKALYNALDELVSAQSRRGVILLTDGAVSMDSFHMYSSRRIINYARSHFIPIHIVHFSTLDDELASIARATGGSVIRSDKTDDLKKLYGLIRDQEEYRYAVVYSTYKTTKKFGGWWSDITLEVNSDGQQGSEWGGYFVPSR